MVLYAIPSANPQKCGATFARWKAMGYSTAVLVDGATAAPANADFVLRVETYNGYSRSVNLLCERHRDVEWLITGGDDIDPDPNRSANDIASECTEHFRGTYGVMQPTGDPLNTDSAGRCAAERICGSPWLGRDFRQRWNGGNGPFWPDYGHFFCDEELHNAALLHGLLWQRKELTHFHNHPSRTGEPMPDYMERAQLRWQADLTVFSARREQGFPGHEPVAA